MENIVKPQKTRNLRRLVEDQREDEEDVVQRWSWPIVVVRFVLLWLLRAFLLMATWNELVRPILMTSIGAQNDDGADANTFFYLRTNTALVLSLIVSAGQFDRPVWKPLQMYFAH
jgi:hypothetical protein